MNRFLAQATAWRADVLYPRRLPDPGPDRPPRYSTESDAAFNQRYYRWRIWLDHDLNSELIGRPPMSYASENEVKAYQEWRDRLSAVKR